MKQKRGNIFINKFVYSKLFLSAAIYRSKRVINTFRSLFGLSFNIADMVVSISRICLSLLPLIGILNILCKSAFIVFNLTDKFIKIHENRYWHLLYQHFKDYTKTVVKVCIDIKVFVKFLVTYFFNLNLYER